MDPVAIQCPKCGVKLTLTSANVLGKKVACPKCKQPFVAKPPSQPPEVPDPQSRPATSGESDALPGQGHGWSAPAVATTSRLSAKSPLSKQAGRTGGRKRAWIAGCSLLGVSLVVGLAWIVAGGSSDPGRDSRLDLAYLPPDSEVVVSCRLADIWKAPILEPLPEPVESQSLDEFNAAWQVELDVRDQPAGELLARLTEELEITLKPLPGQEAARAGHLQVCKVQRQGTLPQKRLRSDEPCQQGYRAPGDSVALPRRRRQDAQGDAA